MNDLSKNIIKFFGKGFKKISLSFFVLKVTKMTPVKFSGVKFFDCINKLFNFCCRFNYFSSNSCNLIDLHFSNC